MECRSKWMKLLILLKRLNIYVIEDCAQAVGAKIGNQMLGRLEISVVLVSTRLRICRPWVTAEAVATNNGQIADRIRRLRMYGEDTRYHSLEPSGHSRLEEIQAAILRVKLPNLKDELKKKGRQWH